MRASPVFKAGLMMMVLCSMPVIVGCGSNDHRRQIRIDGSSTVYPITEKVANEFKKKEEFKDVKITVGISGTGGGFKKFYGGETDISNASRKIKESEEKKCKKAGIDFIELQIGIDGLAVIINKKNTFAEKMTVAQLKKIWHPDEAAKTWKDVNPKWPAEEIVCFAPGSDSGTFDYFTEEINGKEDKCRSDVDFSEDDNNIVKGVAGNEFAIGFLGVAYYKQNKEKLTAVHVAVDEDSEYVPPTDEDIFDGKYTPLSRPLFIYVKKSSLKNPVVREFCRFYLRRSDLVAAVGYVELPKVTQLKMQKGLDSAINAVTAK